jgi:hypothetical protein
MYCAYSSPRFACSLSMASWRDSGYRVGFFLT